MLERLGWKSDVVADGAAAVAAVKSNPEYSIILMDVQVSRQ
jgi:CheY-like chemotaxis protein